MSIANAMTVARNGAFIDRARYQLTSASVDVMAEVNTTTNHTARVAYAKTVIAGTADFAAVAFSATPEQVATPLTPLANNPHARSAPFVTLPPGEYRVYVFQLTLAGKPEPDYLSCDTLVIYDETKASQVVNIHVSQ